MDPRQNTSSSKNQFFTTKYSKENFNRENHNHDGITYEKEKTETKRNEKQRNEKFCPKQKYREPAEKRRGCPETKPCTGIGINSQNASERTLKWMNKSIEEIIPFYPVNVENEKSVFSLSPQSGLRDKPTSPLPRQPYPEMTPNVVINNKTKISRTLHSTPNKNSNTYENSKIHFSNINTNKLYNDLTDDFNSSQIVHNQSPDSESFNESSSNALSTTVDNAKTQNPNESYYTTKNSKNSFLNETDNNQPNLSNHYQNNPKNKILDNPIVIPYKEYVPRNTAPDDGIPVVNLSEIPMGKLRDATAGIPFTPSKFQQKYVDNPNHKFTTKHIPELKRNSINEKLLSVIDLGSNWTFKNIFKSMACLGQLKHGKDWTAMIAPIKRGDRQVKNAYLYFKNHRAAMIGAYHMCGRATSACFLKNWVMTPFVMAMFNDCNGNFKNFEITWYKADVYKQTLEKCLKKHTDNLRTYTRGRQRNEMHIAKYHYRKLRREQGLTPLTISFDCLQSHFSNLLNPYIKENLFLKPSGQPKIEMEKTIRNKSWTLTNHSNFPIRFWKSSYVKNDDIPSAKKSRMAFKKDAKKFKNGETTIQPKRHLIRDLQNFDISNNVVRANDHAYALNRKWIFYFNESKWGTMSRKELFWFKMSEMEAKSSSSQIACQANLTLEEFDDIAIWVAAGQSVDKKTMDLLHHERARHEKIEKEFNDQFEHMSKRLDTAMNAIAHNRKLSDARHSQVQGQLKYLAKESFSYNSKSDFEFSQILNSENLLSEYISEIDENLDIENLTKALNVETNVYSTLTGDNDEMTETLETLKTRCEEERENVVSIESELPRDKIKSKYRTKTSGNDSNQKNFSDSSSNFINLNKLKEIIEIPKNLEIRKIKKYDYPVVLNSYSFVDIENQYEGSHVLHEDKLKVRPNPLPELSFGKKTKTKEREFEIEVEPSDESSDENVAFSSESESSESSDSSESENENEEEEEDEDEAEDDEDEIETEDAQSASNPEPPETQEMSTLDQIQLEKSLMKPKGLKPIDPRPPPAFSILSQELEADGVKKWDIEMRMFDPVLIDEETSLYENSKAKFSSFNGIEISSVPKFIWPSKKCAETDSVHKLDLCNSRSSSRVWQSLLLEYTPFVATVVDCISEMEDLDADVRKESATLKNNLELLSYALNDQSFFHNLATIENNGLQYFPRISKLLLINLIHFLPAIAKELNFAIKVKHTNETIKRQIVEIVKKRDIGEKSKTKKDEGKNEDKGKENARNFIFNDRDLYHEGEELDDIYENDLNFIQEISTNFDESSEPEYDGANSNDSFDINPPTGEISIPNHELEHVLGFIPSYEPVINSVNELQKERSANLEIRFRDNEFEIGDIVIEETNELYDMAKDNLDRNIVDHGLTIEYPKIKSKYTPKLRAEQADKQSDNIKFREQIIFNSNDKRLMLKNFSASISKEFRFNKKRSLRKYGLTFLYTNLNPPITNKINFMKNNFPKAGFISVVECRCKTSEVLDLSVVPIGMRAFTHKETKSKRCYAIILAKTDLAKKCKIIFDEAPFVAVEYKDNRQSFVVATFYKPFELSSFWDRDFTKDNFVKNLEKLVKVIGKRPCILTGDTNVDINKPRNQDERFWANKFERYLGHFQVKETNDTFIRNELVKSKIDYCWTKDLPENKFNTWDGKDMADNDGHVVFELRTNYFINGVIGKKIINTRPKLNQNQVYNLAKASENQFFGKLNALKENWMETIPEDPNEPIPINTISNTYLEDSDNNEYCKYAVEFLENFFETLQPVTTEEKEIRNNFKVYGPEYVKISVLITNLKTYLKQKRRLGNRVEIQECIERLEELKTRRRRWDEKIHQIGHGEATDDDIYKIAKQMRPKYRALADSAEIFTSQQLADEYIRLYNTITQHIQDSNEYLDILDYLPENVKNQDFEKFDFRKWTPTWDNSIKNTKTMNKCFNQLKATTKGLNSSLYRDALAMLPPSYIKIICNIIKYWLVAGNYPIEFLMGKLKPILKKGDVNLIKNRRFISVGTLFQQLLGKIVASILLGYMEKINFLHKDQYGFRSGKSCPLAVAYQIFKVKARPKNVVSRLIFLDLSSAFFCVKKEQLITILKKVCSEEAIKFFEKMLKPREAVVISENVFSEEMKIPNDGVPQGEPCSPLFFNIMMNGIFFYVPRWNGSYTVKNGVTYQCFADDSVLDIFNNFVKRLNEETDKAIERTFEFVSTIGFKINPDKSECMHVGDQRKIKKMEKVIKTKVGNITVKKDTNFLGLRINDKLSFEPHYKHVMAKLKGIEKLVFDLKGLGTKRQVVANAFSRSSGLYLYGLGIQPKWSKKKYNDMQSIVYNALCAIYDTKMRRKKKISQREILRFAKWPPIRLQHLRANLTLLNRAIMDKRLKNFNEIVKKFLFFEDMTEFTTPNNGKIPIITIKEDERNEYGPDIWSAFPLNSKPFFELLPNSVKKLLGTKKFDKAIAAFVKVSCWHREIYDCSECQRNRNTNYAYTEFENQIFEEIHGITDDEVEEFMDSIDIDNSEENERSFESSNLDIEAIFEGLQDMARQFEENNEEH